MIKTHFINAAYQWIIKKIMYPGPMQQAVIEITLYTNKHHWEHVIGENLETRPSAYIYILLL